ncbi:MAG TPA: isocitrate/isopropylmalate family dehydrogenase, partial [Planctomycetota bacterium]|nr:isocitrate/isopropylmalate family dehydrogenase [Planctomycetota bacterium]
MHRIAVIGGDGTGPEVVAEGLKVLKAVAKLKGFAYETKTFDYGGERYLATGEILPEGAIDALRKFDAIYLGAVGHPDVAPGILEKGLLLRLRFELDQYINLRPVKLYPGVACPLKDKGPEDIDFVVVRENTEGLYTGMGGVQYQGTPNEVATQIMCNTRFGVERAIRYAFDLTRKRGRKRTVSIAARDLRGVSEPDASGRVTFTHYERGRMTGKLVEKSDRGIRVEVDGMLTLSAKTNVLTYAHGMWFRAFNEVGEKDYPEIYRDYAHVDATCMWFVKNPEWFDVIVVCNMFGDIITDLGAMIQGGMGVAASGNINPEGVSMFEPIHGSAPKYAGQNVICPIASICAVGMMMVHLGEA